MPPRLELDHSVKMTSFVQLQVHSTSELSLGSKRPFMTPSQPKDLVDEHIRLDGDYQGTSLSQGRIVQYPGVLSRIARIVRQF